MRHFMKLQKQPFEMIKNGEKTIELRLYDEKRKRVSKGDTIVFENASAPNEKLCVTVADLFVFDSFVTLYASLPLLECGYTTANLAEASPDDMNAYYSAEEQKKYGVVGIKIKLQ